MWGTGKQAYVFAIRRKEALCTYGGVGSSDVRLRASCVHFYLPYVPNPNPGTIELAARLGGNFPACDFGPALLGNRTGSILSVLDRKPGYLDIAEFEQERSTELHVKQRWGCDGLVMHGMLLSVYSIREVRGP